MVGTATPHLLRFLYVMLMLTGAAAASAQPPDAAVQLIGTWTLLADPHATNLQPASVNFQLTFFADYTIHQGLPPDAIITGKWHLDESQRVLTVTDDVTGARYNLRIVAIRDSLLTLQHLNTDSSYIHYQRRR